MTDARLERLRSEIDQLDERLVELLGRRFRVTHEIGRLKKDLSLSAVDEQREEHQRTRVRRLAQEHGVSEHVALKVFRVILDEVVTNHRKV